MGSCKRHGPLQSSKSQHKQCASNEFTRVPLHCSNHAANVPHLYASVLTLTRWQIDGSPWCQLVMVLLTVLPLHHFIQLVLISPQLLVATCTCLNRSTDLWISSTRFTIASDGLFLYGTRVAAELSDRALPMSTLAARECSHENKCVRLSVPTPFKLATWAGK